MNPFPELTIRLRARNKGQSIVGALIGIAITGILIAVITSLFGAQAREITALKEQLASADLTRALTVALASPSACSSIFAAGNLVTPNSIPFDASAVSYPYVIPIKSIPSAGIASGEQASSFSPTLVLSPQSGNPSGLQLVFADATTAVLQVNFDQAKLVRAIHNLSFPVVTTVSGGMTSVGACISQLRTWSKRVNNSIPVPGVSGPSISCPAGMMVSSCTTLQAPAGGAVCGTTISGSGDSCVPGACLDPGFGAGQVWSTLIICAGMQ